MNTLNIPPDRALFPPLEHPVKDDQEPSECAKGPEKNRPTPASGCPLGLLQGPQPLLCGDLPPVPLGLRCPPRHLPTGRLSIHIPSPAHEVPLLGWGRLTPPCSYSGASGPPAPRRAGTPGIIPYIPQDSHTRVHTHTRTRTPQSCPHSTVSATHLSPLEAGASGLCLPSLVEPCILMG